MTGSLTVSETSHPQLYRAMIDLSYYNDMINRDNPKPETIEVPEEYRELAEEAEKELAAADLSDDDMETLTDGEDTEIQAMVEKQSLHSANQILNRFFEGWVE